MTRRLHNPQQKKPRIRLIPALAGGIVAAGLSFAAHAQITVRDATALEGNAGTSPLNFIIERTGDLTQPARVTVRTANGATNPATAGTDFTALAETDFTIPANNNQITVPVTITGDNVPEADETLLLQATRAVTPTAFALTTSAQPIGASPSHVTAVDLNADGLAELITANAATDNITILRNTSTVPTAATFAAAQNVVVGDGPRYVAARDLNGDGKPDLVVSNENANTISILVNTSVNNGAITFNAAIVRATENNPFGLALADVDGDGLSDIVVANQAFSSVSIFLVTMPGNVFTVSAKTTIDLQPGTPGLGPTEVRAADLNGDGKVEIVTANRDGPNLTVLINGSTPATLAFGRLNIANPGATPRSLAIADLDGNGQSDLAVGSNTTNTLTLFRNTTAGGALSFAAPVTLNAGFNTVSISTARLDGDTLPDLVATASTADQAQVFLNTSTVGNFTFAAAEVFATGDNPQGTVAADLTGDGKADLATSNIGTNNLTVLVNNPDTALTLDDPEGLGTITNDDNTTVQFTVADAINVAENVGLAQVLNVSLTPASSQVVTVTFALDGTATLNRDYSVLPAGNTVTFAAGEANKTITLNVTDDPRDDALENETVIVRLTAVTNSSLGANLERTLTIADNDAAPTTAFAANGATVAEGGAAGAAGVVLSAQSEKPVTVPYSIAVGGTAANGTDFTLAPASPLTIPALADGANIAINAIDDARDEEDTETALIALGAPTANATAGAANQNFLISIADNDLPPTVTFAANASATGEGSAASLINVTLTPASEREVQVAFTTGGSASNADVDNVSASPLVIPRLATGASISFTPVDDATEEGNETLTFTLAAPAAVGPTYRLGANDIHTVTIGDNDQRVSVAGGTVTEGNAGTANLTFTVTLSQATTQTVTVNFATAAGGTATTDVDFTTTSGTVTFPANTLTQTFTIPVNGDTRDEPNETVLVTLSNPVNARLGTANATGTIVDDDAGPVINVQSNGNVTEGDNAVVNATFTVTLASASEQTVSVGFVTSSGTAEAGIDFNSASGILTFAPGELTKTFTVGVVGDRIDEDNETFNVTLENPTNGSIGTATAAATIIDNDAAASLSISNITIQEGDSGTQTARFTVRLSPASGRTVRVQATTGDANDTATGGVDYLAQSNVPLTFDPGVTSQDFEVTIIGDRDDEIDEIFTVTLGTPQNAVIAVSSATGTIFDNDLPPTVQFETATLAVGESGSVSVPVTLSNPIGQTVTVNYSVLSSSTASTQDHTLVSGTLSLPPQTVRGLIQFQIRGDSIDENDETVTIQLTQASRATLGGLTEHTVTIQDDDAQPVVFYLEETQSVDEGSSATVELALSSASGRAITVRLVQATQSTASSGRDYTLPSTQLTIPAGETAATFTVNTLTDGDNEADETVVIRLGSITNATATTPNTHTVTIRDTNVSTVTTQDSNGNTVTASSERGNISRIERTTTPAEAPTDVDYPHGFFATDITNLTPGETVQVSLALPSSARPSSYILCSRGTCERYNDVIFNNNIVTLTLTDGGPEDADGLVNGRISISGAPSVAKSTSGGGGTGTVISGGEGGGGAFNPLLLLGLLILAGWKQRSGRPFRGARS